MMDNKCQFIDSCPMFKYFCRAAQIIYSQVYCEGDYESCERLKRRINGQPVPENLLPQGLKLWPDGETPPEEFFLS